MAQYVNIDTFNEETLLKASKHNKNKSNSFFVSLAIKIFILIPSLCIANPNRNRTSPLPMRTYNTQRPTSPAFETLVLLHAQASETNNPIIVKMMLEASLLELTKNEVAHASPHLLYFDFYANDRLNIDTASKLFNVTFPSEEVAEAFIQELSLMNTDQLLEGSKKVMDLEYLKTDDNHKYILFNMLKAIVLINTYANNPDLNKDFFISSISGPLQISTNPNYPIFVGESEDTAKNMLIGLTGLITKNLNFKSISARIRGLRLLKTASNSLFREQVINNRRVRTSVKTLLFSAVYLSYVGLDLSGYTSAIDPYIDAIINAVVNALYYGSIPVAGFIAYGSAEDIKDRVKDLIKNNQVLNGLATRLTKSLGNNNSSVSICKEILR